MNKKDREKFAAMEEAGRISSLALKKAMEAVSVGVKLSHLDKIAEKVIVENGAEPGFKRVDDYDYTTCVNVNGGLVHGIPGDYALRRGDIVSIDLGAFYEGFNSDQCWTVEVETNVEHQFLSAGEKALRRAIEQAREGNRIGDISAAIQNEIERAGYSVSRDLVGHGVGKDLHEFPHVPCYGKAGKGPLLKEGMTLAIEVIYQKGKPEIIVSEDSWTVETKDGSLAAVFEHTIGIRKEGPLVFTEF